MINQFTLDHRPRESEPQGHQQTKGWTDMFQSFLENVCDARQKLVKEWLKRELGEMLHNPFAEKLEKKVKHRLSKLKQRWKL